MYLLNAWYVAAWCDEVSERPCARTLLNTEVVLYRTTEGEAVAMSDRCPHRFVQLHLGRVEGDRIICPYHGLQFDRSGRCVHNPQGNGTIPSSVRVQTYPVIERHNAVWIWMGDTERYDPDRIPDFSIFLDRGRYASVFGYLQINANYRLVSDNLLDLGHVEFIHPALGTPGSSARSKYTSNQDGDAVESQWAWTDEPITPIFRVLWDKAEKGPIERFEFVQKMRWQPPSHLKLDIWSHRKGESRQDGVSLPSAHLLTPRDENSTHYFWALGRDCALNDRGFDDQLRHMIAEAFNNEDAPMIESQQSYLPPGSDLMSYKPLLLAGDAGAVRARRVLNGLIDREARYSGSGQT